MSEARPAWRVLAPVLERIAALDRGVERAQLVGRHLLEGLLPAVLSPEELVDLSARLYARLGPRGEAAWRAPFDWEERWLAEVFPPAPATVLVGGAGFGREPAWLRARGHRVFAYEPSPTAVARIEGVEEAVAASHEDLAAAALDGRDGPCAALAARRYDLVLLGWGSLSHVLSPSDRLRVLRACVALTDGPVLASARVAAASERPTRAARLGARLARALGGHEAPPGLHYQPQHGFAAALTPAELGSIADAIGRRLVTSEAGGLTAIALLP